MFLYRIQRKKEGEREKLKEGERKLKGKSQKIHEHRVCVSHTEVIDCINNGHHSHKGIGAKNDLHGTERVAFSGIEFSVNSLLVERAVFMECQHLYQYKNHLKEE